MVLRKIRFLIFGAIKINEALGGVNGAIEFLVNPPGDFASDVKMILELRKVQSQLWAYYMPKKNNQQWIVL